MYKEAHREIEAAGAIPLSDEGQYVVKVEQILEVLSTSLKHQIAVNVVGRTSDTEGAAFIISASENNDKTEFPDGFFPTEESRAGLSQALLAVIDRRS